MSNKDTGVMMDPYKIIEKYYYPHSKTYKMLVTHSRMVAGKALDVASKVSGLNPDMELDMELIEQGALLHDIGIFKVHAHQIGCIGPMQYVEHGYLGRELLEEEGLPKHALICERHVGLGISKEDIAKFKLPLPERDMVPESLEERIICYADKFFSKWPTRMTEEMPVDKVRKKVEKYGEAQLARFDEWHELFGG